MYVSLEWYGSVSTQPATNVHALSDTMISWSWTTGYYDIFPHPSVIILKVTIICSFSGILITGITHYMLQIKRGPSAFLGTEFRILLAIDLTEIDKSMLSPKFELRPPSDDRTHKTDLRR